MKTVNTLWRKTPAWIKAIILNIILLYPIIIAVQTILSLNTGLYSNFPWSVLVAGLLLLAYFLLTRRFAKFDQSKDVKLELRFDVKNTSNWVYIFGILFLATAIFYCVTLTFEITSSKQLEYIQSFTNLGPLTAIPILIMLAFSAGLVEEITYRGYIQNTLTRKYSRWISFGITGLLFAALHFLPLPLILPYAIVSMLFSYIADQTRSTGVVIFAHFLVDAASFLLIYFAPTTLETPTPMNIGIVTAMFATGVLCMLAPQKLQLIQSNQRSKFELTD